MSSANVKDGKKRVKNDFANIILRKLYDNVNTADVFFKFASEPKMVGAHRLILAGGSDVFWSMFYGDLKEAEHVTIVDFSYDVFFEFINLFYLTDPRLTKDNIFEVLRAVDKYDVRDSLPICEQFLLTVMSRDNVCEVIEAAIKYRLSSLVTFATESVIKTNPEHVFRSAGFLFCEKEVLEYILRVDALDCSDELDVFRAAMEWADRRCNEKGKTSTDINKRMELGDCFQLIRFATLTAAEFLQLNDHYPEMFTHQEFKEILNHIVRAKPLKLFANFNSTKRIFPRSTNPEQLNF